MVSYIDEVLPHVGNTLIGTEGAKLERQYHHNGPLIRDSER